MGDEGCGWGEVGRGEGHEVFVDGFCGGGRVFWWEGDDVPLDGRGFTTFDDLVCPDELFEQGSQDGRIVYINGMSFWGGYRHLVFE